MCMSGKANPWNRRSVIKAGAATTSLGVLGGCLGNTASSGPEPLRIGAPTSVTGPYSQAANFAREGIEFAANQLRNDPDFDRDVEVFYEDTELDPSKAISATKRMVQDDGCQTIAGVSSSSNALAIVDFIKETDTMFVSKSSSTRLQRDKCTDTMFKMYIPGNYSNIQQVMPTVKAEDLGERWYTIAADYAVGHELLEEIEAVASDDNKYETVGSDIVPFGHEDYGPIMSKIEDADADLIWMANWGGDTAAALRQAISENMHIDKNIVVPQFIDTAAVVQPAEALREVYGGVSWTRDTATLYDGAKEFVNAWIDEHDQSPTEMHGLAYKQAIIPGELIKRTGSMNPVDWAADLEGREFELINGPGTYYREEDHVEMKPWIQIRGKDPAEKEDEWDLFEAIDTVSEDKIYPAQGCTFETEG